MRLGRQFYILLLVLPVNLLFSVISSCSQNIGNNSINGTYGDSLAFILPGAFRTEEYLPLLANKKVAVVANHTSLIGREHLVDSLIRAGVEVVKIFSPEHGFRGNIGAGEEVHDYIDRKTGLKVISLYGDSYKPASEDLKDIDVLLFDIQDVGVRFYTYISTMHYVMEACAENGIGLIILDRPNPNGFYIDGPVLDFTYQSFVGLHPIPVVYGMTMAELALMINGEGWLKDGITCSLQCILCKNYTHDSLYQLQGPPSPNLQNMKAVYLYPSLGLFEGTKVTVARGTDFPFQAFGHPDFPDSGFSFLPHSIENISPDPKYNNQVCYGTDLRNYNEKALIQQERLNLDWLIMAYKNYKGADFFNPYFFNLSGNDELAKQIKEGKSAEEIREGWKKEITEFKKTRGKYLLYEDFK